MTDLILSPSPGELIAPDKAIQLPKLIVAAGPRAERRFLEFFAAQIPNPNTRAAYLRVVGGFFGFMSDRGNSGLPEIEPLHVAA